MDYHAILEVNKSDISKSVDYCLKLCTSRIGDINKSVSKLTETKDFMIDLVMSSVNSIEKPKDIIFRTLLTLIVKMRQNQVIKELLDPSSVTKNKKKKKKK
jgi:hypothetical protein